MPIVITNSCIKEHGSNGCSTGLTALSMNNKLIAYYLKYKTLFISCWCVCVWRGDGLVVTNCTGQVVTSINSLIL